MNAWSGQRMKGDAYINGTGGFADDRDYFESQALGSAKTALLSAGVDHLEVLQSNCTQAFVSLPRLIRGRELPWPSLAMARIVLESSARFCYVLDPDIKPEQRLMRMAAFMVWSTGEQTTMAKTSMHPDPEALAAMRARVDEHAQKIHDLVSDAGFGLDGDRVVDLTGNFKATSAKIGAVDLVRSEFPAYGEESYRRLSGFVHGAPWALGSALHKFAEKTYSPTVDGQTVVSVFNVTGASISTMMVRSCNYSGMEAGDVGVWLRVLETVSKHELERLDAPGAAPRFVGPGRGWQGRFAPVIIRAWGRVPVASHREK